MARAQVVRVTPAEATALIHGELTQADHSLQADDLNAALDGYVRALGLALQLGPAPTEQVLRAILQAAGELALARDSGSLSALGPALAGVVTQVREAEALPSTAVMEAWGTLASDLGALVGQLGLALSLPPGHRAGMMENAQRRAALLDEATGSHFALGVWLKEISP